MDIQRIIGELRAERARLDEALLHLEKLSLARTPRRGRPPNWRREANLAAAQNGRVPGDSPNAARRLVAGA
jgi:hypothetical protein